MKTLIVGADIAKATFTGAQGWGEQVTYLAEFGNDKAGFNQLGERVKAFCQAAGIKQVHLIVEPTGAYELGLVNFAYEQGWWVSLPNPKQVRRWAEGSGKRTKTDRQDACLLAEYGSKQKLLPQQPLPEAVSQLDSLLHRRQDLEKLLRAERNRLLILRQRPGTPPAVLDSVERIIAALEAELAAIEQAIQELLTQNPDLKRQAKQLRTVPGIGPKNVLPILVLLHRWQALTQGTGTPKGLTAFLGLDPRHHVSGSSVHKRSLISKMGDSTGRHLFYLGALGGVRGHNPLRDFYQRLVGRGKAKRLALVAAARKILLWDWAVFSRILPLMPLVSNIWFLNPLDIHERIYVKF